MGGSHAHPARVPPPFPPEMPRTGVLESPQVPVESDESVHATSGGVLICGKCVASAHGWLEMAEPAIQVRTVPDPDTFLVKERA